MDDHLVIPQRETTANDSIPKHSMPTSFLTLACEIRGSIYELVLVAPQPIPAWYGMPVSELEFWHFDHALVEHLDFMMSTETAECQHFKKLVQTHSVISREAARVYYSRNVFVFSGDFKWSVMLTWLETIGCWNRSWLTGLTVCLRSPQYVRQLPDGARTQVEPNVHPFFVQENARERIYPRSRFLYLPQDTGFYDSEPDPDLEGFVTNISPHVEDIFSLLGSTNGPKVTISLVTAYSMDYIGYDHQGDWSLCDLSSENDGNWLYMDLPNVIKKCRELYSSGSGKRLDVLWKGGMNKDFLRENGQILQDLGWDILDTSQSVIDVYIDQLSITLKQKEIRGIIMPDKPQLRCYYLPRDRINDLGRV